MGDRHLMIRDRALILRVLVPGLETRLRDKMKEAEDIEDPAGNDNSSNSNNNNNTSSFSSRNKSVSTTTNKEILIDLEGIACEPTQDSSTLWNFHCDGATYPARLVNLPCPVEVHKTHDHAMYYKSCDIVQMLIVYEDSMALDEADAYPKTDGYPSYYHSGIIPPMKRVVERRFAFREHQPGTKYPRNEVSDVEKELHELMCKISKEGGKGRKLKIPSLATAQHQNKILQEVEEVIVDYEPWMDNNGTEKKGISFDATDQIASMHPEIWLSPESILEIKEKEREKEEEEEKKRQKEREKKQKRKKKKEEKKLAAKSKTKSKGIASKKNVETTDDITAAATLALVSGEVNFDEDDFGDLGFDTDDLQFDFSNDKGLSLL